MHGISTSQNTTVNYASLKYKRAKAIAYPREIRHVLFYAFYIIRLCRFKSDQNEIWHDYTSIVGVGIFYMTSATFKIMHNAHASCTPC